MDQNLPPSSVITNLLNATFYEPCLKLRKELEELDTNYYIKRKDQPDSNALTIQDNSIIDVSATCLEKYQLEQNNIESINNEITLYLSNTSEDFQTDIKEKIANLQTQFNSSTQYQIESIKQELQDFKDFIVQSNNQIYQQIIRLFDNYVDLKEKELETIKAISKSNQEHTRKLQEQRFAYQSQMQERKLQAKWDEKTWFSKVSRNEIERILKNQKELLILVSPPKFSSDCPQNLINNLPIEINNEVKAFADVLNGDVDSYPIKVYTDLFKEAVTSVDLERLSDILSPLPFASISCEVTDYKLYINCTISDFYEKNLFSLPLKEWKWGQDFKELFKKGESNSNRLKIVRQITVAIHKILVALLKDIYSLILDPYSESWLLKAEGSYFLKKDNHFLKIMGLDLEDANFALDIINPVIDLIKEIQYQYQFRFWYNRGCEFFNKNEYDKAINLLLKAEEYIHKVSIDDFYCQLGMAYYCNSNFEKALNYFHKEIKLNSKNFNVWYYSAKSLSHLKDYDNALSNYEKALSIKPYDLDTILSIGEILIRFKNYKETIEKYILTINYYTEDDISANCHIFSKIFSQRAYLYIRLENFNNAFNDLQEILKLYPEFFEEDNLCNLCNGIIYLNNKKYEESLYSFNKVSDNYIEEELKLYFEPYEFYYYKGQAESGFGRYSDATESYNIALKNNPKLEKNEEFLSAFEKAKRRSSKVCLVITLPIFIVSKLLILIKNILNFLREV
ncbi:hypothetical protein PCC9214_04162 [Planktothrix tepida]|uniref:Uncharacterized protein n=1 Tax=Planktothrix tepida PCC 9214 TaxID=671072 RepID=A0A1J1LTD8_9CYAN|nr:tetratricopeptide repeat protein [Planktothrix tepida]CAD5975964.1 hypothetical protein PCC9214_04162 [Planktothrix tepida]CUR35864.1 hypothetical protein PL9214750002 [Planktothrix tepida PCC 9214]